MHSTFSTDLHYSSDTKGFPLLPLLLSPSLSVLSTRSHPSRSPTELNALCKQTNKQLKMSNISPCTFPAISDTYSVGLF